MKANEAPKKIYCGNNGHGNLSYSNLPFPNAVEYTRNDAFIEKLECWMDKNFYQYAGEFAEGILAQFGRTEDAIEDFRNYMKGE